MPTIPANANGQTEATALSGVGNFIVLNPDDKWGQCPRSLVQGTSLDVSAKTANYTVTAAESGTLFTNAGASGTVVLALPAAVAGLHYRALVRASQALRFDPNGTDVIAHMTAGSADGGAGKYTGSSTLGAAIHLVCTADGRWDVVSVKGTWTLEA